ncbi:MAG: hypothetical protein GY797_17455 [Deltaproteobacteria bacterium]|nr:hypothetical protein [Deltaproteobacteria bacterium]
MGINSNRKRVKSKTETKKLPIKRLPQKRDVLKEDDGPIMLDGDDALLLAEACKLNKEKKAAEKRIKKIKTVLDLNAGEYMNKAGDKLVLSEADKFSEIDPERLFKLFVKNRKKQKFWTVVKVQIGEVSKIVPESSIKKLREKLDPIMKWSFK